MLRHSLPLALLVLTTVLAAGESEPPKTGNYRVDRALASDLPLDRVNAVLGLYRSQLTRRRTEVSQRIQEDPAVVAALAAAFAAEKQYRDALAADPACGELAGKLEAKRAELAEMQRNRPNIRNSGAYRKYRDRRTKLYKQVNELSNQLADKADASPGLTPLRAASDAAAEAALKIFTDKLLADEEQKALTAQLEELGRWQTQLYKESARAKQREQEEQKRAEEEKKKAAAEEKKRAEEEKRKKAAEEEKKKAAEEAKKTAAKVAE